jgi:RNA polymerase sigma-70 factor (ECF subfamily)
VTPAYTEGAGFVEVARTHTDPLVRLARRLVGSVDDAEEIVQEALLRAYADRMRRSREPKDLAASVYTITRNLSIDHLRRKRAHPVERASLECRPDPRPGPAQALELAALRAAVRQAVADLPRPYRQVVTLRYGFGYSYRGIAKELRLRMSAVEARLHRAKKRLRRALRHWVAPTRSGRRRGAGRSVPATRSA